MGGGGGTVVAALTAGAGAPAIPAGAVEGSLVGGTAGLTLGKTLSPFIFREGNANGSDSPKPKKQPGETGNVNHAFRKLGVDRNEGSDILHQLKRAAGLRGGDNVWINTETGAVRSQQNGEVIGNILDGS